jgi:hypothetical protein
MESWARGDRVVHSTFGSGTILETNEQHTVIHFDNHGRRVFSTRLVQLQATGEPPKPVGPLPSIPLRPRTTSKRSTTDVGYENGNRQTVLRQTSLSGNLPGQRVYVLKCRNCGHQYGANGCDIHLRRCPHCDVGQPGLAF